MHGRPSRLGWRRHLGMKLPALQLESTEAQDCLRLEGIEMADCPECGAEIVEVADLEEGEIVNCEDCGVELEVIAEAPLEFALAPEEEEDWGQ